MRLVGAIGVLPALRIAPYPYEEQDGWIPRKRRRMSHEQTGSDGV